MDNLSTGYLRYRFTYLMSWISDQGSQKMHFRLVKPTESAPDNLSGIPDKLPEILGNLSNDLKPSSKVLEPYPMLLHLG